MGRHPDNYCTMAKISEMWWPITSQFIKHNTLQAGMRPTLRQMLTFSVENSFCHDCRPLEMFADAREASSNPNNRGVLDLNASTIFPGLALQLKKDKNNSQEQQQEAAASSSSSETIDNNQERINEPFPKARWLNCIYVDRHECKAVVANWQTFCEAHLTKFKPYCKCWTHCPMSKALTLKACWA